jgi:hypothetical protein
MVTAKECQQLAEMNDFHPAEPLEGMQPINTLILAQRN